MTLDKESDSLRDYGNGSEENPFKIRTADELDNIRSNLQAHYILMNDIDLSGYANWNPIGSDGSEFTMSFTGSLDGKGHVIKNLHIKSNEDYQGLFGCTKKSAKLKNIGLEDVNICGKNSIGGLAGYAWQSVITSCYSTGSVTGNKDVGGLVGTAADFIINSCYSTCSVTGNEGIGGLVGQSFRSASITRCYSTGSVTGKNSIGGLVGHSSGSASITSCISLNTKIHGNNSVSATVGSKKDRVTASNCKYWRDMSITGTYVDGVVGTSVPASEILNTFPNGIWKGWNTNVWKANGGNPDYCLPVLIWQKTPVMEGAKHLNEEQSMATKITSISEYYKEFPSLIATAEDLNAVRNNLSAHYLLTADIDLAEYENWEPIGTKDKPFTGSFDGGWHIIRNLRIVDRPKGYLGLFGYAKNAELKNISLENVCIYGGHKIGGLAGATEHSTIIACCSAGTISGLDYTGGLVGKTVDSTITECSSASKICAHAYVGGLAGHSWFSNISSCHTEGTVFGEYEIGGLAGYVYASSIHMCCAAGTVSGRSVTGGLVGLEESADIYMCDFTGSVLSAAGSRLIGEMSNFIY